MEYQVTDIDGNDTLGTWVDSDFVDLDNSDNNIAADIVIGIS